MKMIEGWKIGMNGGKLLVDFTMKPWGDELKHRTDEQITYKSTAEIISLGYRECIGYKTKLAYYKIPVYVKFHNFKKFDYSHGWTDEFGNPVDPETYEGAIYPMPLDTANTLYDYYRSAAIANFKRGMAKISTLPEMDLKMLGMIGIVAAGVICGLVLLIR